MATSERALERAAAESGTLSERAASLIEQDILAGHLPPGSRLGIIELVQRYEIGATPLREGLSRPPRDDARDHQRRRFHAQSPGACRPRARAGRCRRASDAGDASALDHQFRVSAGPRGTFMSVVASLYAARCSRRQEPLIAFN